MQRTERDTRSITLQRPYTRQPRAKHIQAFTTRITSIIAPPESSSTYATPTQTENTMPSHRLSPARSLQKLRTVFSQPQSPTNTTSPTAPSPLNNNTTPASPTSPTLTVSPTPSFSHQFAGFAGFSFGAAPSPTFASPEDFSSIADSRRVIRRKKSCVEIEIERERVEFDGALVEIVEPRPRIGVALGGIEEVLCGEV